MGLLNTGSSILLIAIFSLAIITFAISFAQNNTTSISIADDSQMSGIYTNMSGSLQNTSSASQSQSTSLVNTTIQEGSDYPKSLGAFTITGSDYYQVFLNIVPVGMKRIFGDNAFINYVVTGVLGFAVVALALYAWKASRGLPD